MKNRNIQLKAVLLMVALAITPIFQAAAQSDGADVTSPDQGPAITIHSTDNVVRGQTSAFVLSMKSANINAGTTLGGMYVKFLAGGTAVPGVDYVALVSPAYIGRSGYAVLLIKALPDPRGSAIRKAYSVVIKLQDGPGYSLGQPSTATMWIKP